MNSGYACEPSYSTDTRRDGRGARTGVTSNCAGCHGRLHWSLSQFLGLRRRVTLSACRRSSPLGLCCQRLYGMHALLNAGAFCREVQHSLSLSLCLYFYLGCLEGPEQALPTSSYSTTAATLRRSRRFSLDRVPSCVGQPATIQGAIAWWLLSTACFLCFCAGFSAFSTARCFELRASKVLSRRYRLLAGVGLGAHL